MTKIRIDALMDSLQIMHEMCGLAGQFGCKFTFHTLSGAFDGKKHTLITLSKGEMSWAFALGYDNSSFQVSRTGESLCDFSFHNSLLFTADGEFNGGLVLMLLFYTVESAELLLSSAKNAVYEYVSESTFEYILPQDKVVPMIADLRRIWCNSQEELRTPKTVYVPDYATVEDYIAAMAFVSTVCMRNDPYEQPTEVADTRISQWCEG